MSLTDADTQDPLITESWTHLGPFRSPSAAPPLSLYIHVRKAHNIYMPSGVF